MVKWKSPGHTMRKDVVNSLAKKLVFIPKLYDVLSDKI